MNLYPVDKAIGFPNAYPLDSDLYSGQRYQRFNNRGLDINPNGGIVLRDTNIAFSLGFF